MKRKKPYPKIRYSIILLLSLLISCVSYADPGGKQLPVGYDNPASDKGGPQLKGGLEWIEKVFTRTIKFAEKPVWKKPTVMFITNEGGVDTVFELNRRFPMDVIHFWGYDLKDKKKFMKLLNSRKNIDCFVMSRFNTKSIPPEIQYEILKRVANGAGFVMIDDFDRSKTFYPRFLELKPQKKSKELFPGVPYKGLRKWICSKKLVLPVMNFWNTKSLPYEPKEEPYSYADSTISSFGKGAIVWISTGTHWSRRGRAGRTLLPHITQRRDMWVETDYYYSVAAKAIKTASKLAGGAEIEKINVDGPVKITYKTNAGKEFKGNIRWQIRDTWGKITDKGTIPVTLKAGGGELVLNGVKFKDAGRQFLDLWLDDQQGNTADWASGFRNVDRKVIPINITFKYPEGAPRGVDFEGTISVPEDNRISKIRLTLVDRHWRDVYKQEQPAGPGTVKYRIPSKGLDGQIWNLHVDLLDKDGNILSRSWKTITSPETRKTRGPFQPLMTCCTASGPEDAARVEYLRQLGFLSNRVYSGGSPIMAENMAWNDIQLFPFSFRITHAYDEYKGEHINDWEAPPIKKQLAEVQKLMTQKYRPFGLRGFNLSDDSSPGGQLPKGPYTTIAFHKWLEKEYGSMEATAKAWGIKTSGFGKIHCWGRIHQESVKGWYDMGITAPWIDAQRFLEKNWVDTMVLIKNAVTSVKPDANVGSDASYYKNAMSDLFGKLEYLAPYYRDYAVKVAVARGRIRRPGDYGACLGTYGDKPAQMTGRRSQIWDVLFAGGTGFYFWVFSIGLNEDMNLHDAHALYQCEITEELMNGIAQLFTYARRIFDKVAILDSQTSGICDQLEKKNNPLTSKANSIQAFQHSLEDLGVNPYIINGKELTEGWLSQNNIKLLVLPGVNSLSDKEIATIKSFVHNGGVIVADVRVGHRLPNGNIRKKVEMDQVFGIKSNPKIKTQRSKGMLSGKPYSGKSHNFELTLCDPRIQSTKAKSFATLAKSESSNKEFKPSKALFVNQFGKGKAYLLNASFSSYDTFRSEGGKLWRAWFEVMKHITGDAKLKPVVKGRSEGKETPGFELSPFANGKGYLLGIEDLGCGDFKGKKRPVEVELPGDFHIYEVRSGRYLGKSSKLKDKVPRKGHRAYALLPYEVSDIKVSTGKSKMKAGEMIDVKIKLQTKPEAQLDGHVVRLEVFTPKGESFFPMKRILKLPENGTLNIPMQTAFNDLPGEWTVKVTDIGSGKTASTTIER